MENEQSMLATDLLHEVKMSAKRWFVAFCVMIMLEVLTITGFLWYISRSAEIGKNSTQTMQNVEIDSGSAEQSIGGN